MTPRQWFLLAVLAALVAASPAAAPTGTPTAVIERIAKEVGAGAKDLGFIKKLENIGVDALGNSPGDFAKVLEADTKIWAEAVRVSGAKLE